MEIKNIVPEKYTALLSEMRKLDLISYGTFKSFVKMNDNSTISKNDLLSAIREFYCNESYESLLPKSASMLGLIKELDNSHFVKIKNNYLNNLKSKYTK